MALPPAPVVDAAALGAAIRAARFARGLTQHDLARYLGVPRATIANYETGRRKVPAETLLQIAHVCGTALAFFDPHDRPTAPTPPTSADAGPPELQLVTQLLLLRPDALPPVLAFLNEWLTTPAKS